MQLTITEFDITEQSRTNYSFPAQFLCVNIRPKTSLDYLSMIIVIIIQQMVS